MSKKMWIAANWKMNKTFTEAESYLQGLKSLLPQNSHRNCLLFPPTLYLPLLAKELKGTSIFFGAQNCHFADNGAFTGEISPVMLKECGVTHTLVGHSERRHLFLETDEMIGKKVEALIKYGIAPVLCVGEKEDERLFGKTLDRIRFQLEVALKNVPPTQPLIVAYEPVWAIGTGRVASPQDIFEVHQFIRNELIQRWGDVGREVAILYGGSVNGKNALEIGAIEHVQGFLIGGASLKLESYLEIYNT